ncbi:Uncharacterized protein Rs2_23468 [Raphanus sativus]|nr:Uncharacterized protein Rs2_23468 [Raphanus sativus]
MFLDVGGVSRRRRRDLHLSLFSVPLFLANSSNLSVFCCQCFVFAYALLHSGGLPRPFLVGSRGIESSLSGLGLTGSASFTTYQSWESLSLKICIAGPQDVDYPPPCEADSSQRSRSITLRQVSRVSSALLTCYANLHTGEYQPLFWIDTAYLLGSGLHQPDLKLSLSPPRFGLSMKLITFHRKGISFRQTSRSSSTVTTRTEKQTYHPPYAGLSPGAFSSLLLHRCALPSTTCHKFHWAGQLPHVCEPGELKIYQLSNSQPIIFISFKAFMYVGGVDHFGQFSKNYRGIPWDFYGNWNAHNVLSLLWEEFTLFSITDGFTGTTYFVIITYIFLAEEENRIIPSLIHEDRFPSKPVRLGPEDVTGVITIIFRGADWILTSQFKVTKFQVSGGAMNLALTHSSFAVNSLSFYRGGLSTIILYVSVVLSFVGRVWLNSIFICNPNV